MNAVNSHLAEIITIKDQKVNEKTLQMILELAGWLRKFGRLVGG